MNSFSVCGVEDGRLVPVVVGHIIVGRVTDVCGSAKDICRLHRRVKSTADLKHGSMIDMRITVARK